MLERLPPLSMSENRDSFFKRIARLFPTLSPQYQAIEKAYKAAKDAFHDDVREDGVRYFEHLRGVALILLYLRVSDHELIIAALLHDILEDHPELWPLERIRKEFGERVALLVEYLTKPPESEYSTKEERDHVYHCRFCIAPREFFLIKLADRLHNILTLAACTPEKRRRKIEETWRYYMPFAEENFILYYELEEALMRAEQMQ